MTQDYAEALLVKAYIYNDIFYESIEDLRSRFDLPSGGFQKNEEYEKWMTEHTISDFFPNSYHAYQLEVRRIAKGVIPEVLIFLLDQFIALPKLPLPQHGSIYINDFEKSGAVRIEVLPFAERKELMRFIMTNWKDIRRRLNEIVRPGVERRKRKLDARLLLQIGELRRNGRTYKAISKKLSAEIKGLTTEKVKSLYSRHRPKDVKKVPRK